MADEPNPIATEVIFEDDKVRVWNQVVPAGADIKKHEHLNDYFLINVSGTGPIAVEFHDGTGGDFVENFVFEPKLCSADFIRKGHIDTAHNQGDEHREILCELKC